MLDKHDDLDDDVKKSHFKSNTESSSNLFCLEEESFTLEKLVESSRFHTKAKLVEKVRKLNFSCRVNAISSERFYFAHKCLHFLQKKCSNLKFIFALNKIFL